MERVIIDGATGAIGSALIQELLKHGVEILVFCHRGSKRNVRIPDHPLVSKKYCSLDELKDIQNDTGRTYDVYYHFAWSGLIGADRNDLYLQNDDVKYCLDAVGAAARFGCKKFIGAGSQAEYGRVEELLKSDTPTFPENGYGIAKLCAGQMSRIKAHQLGMEHVWPRILSVYGPYDGENAMMTIAIKKLLAGEKPSFTKGEQKWDYLYSGDAGRAFYLLGEKGKDGKIYTLGSGQARPLAEYIGILRDTIDPRAEIGLGDIPYGAQQVMYLCADISEIEADTGWKPEVEFEDGIRLTVDSYRTPNK